jgi:hypothetical protein
LDEIQTKVFRVFLLAFLVTSSALPREFYFFKLTQPLTVSTVQLIKEKGNPYRNLKSENSQDYAQKPQQICTFMNSASVHNKYKQMYIMTLEEYNI